MTDELTADLFAPHEGTEFLVDAGGAGLVPLRLTSVTRHPVQPDAPRVEPFSLVFTGPAAPALEQQIHALAHPALGLLEIFIVPIGPGPEGPSRYEAVFN
jgi:hypothetical protein